MKNMIHDHTQSAYLRWTNASGSDKASGDFVLVGTTMAACCTVDIANGSSGAVVTRGRFTAPKDDSAAWTQGARLTFDGTKFAVAAAGEPIMAYAAEAAGETDTSGVIELCPMGDVDENT